MESPETIQTAATAQRDQDRAFETLRSQWSRPAFCPSPLNTCFCGLDASSREPSQVAFALTDVILLKIPTRFQVPITPSQSSTGRHWMSPPQCHWE